MDILSQQKNVHILISLLLISGYISRSTVRMNVKSDLYERTVREKKVPMNRDQPKVTRSRADCNSKPSDTSLKILLRNQVIETEQQPIAILMPRSFLDLSCLEATYCDPKKSIPLLRLFYP